MPRSLRFCPAGFPQHVIQRGVNRQFCFVDDQDKGFYIRLLTEYAAELEVQVHAWVLMSNHVHLLCTPGSDRTISLLMQSVGRRYVQYFNLKYERTGGLWEGRFRSFVVESQRYFLTCQRYVELNPVRAGMVTLPGGYAWSSFRCHGMGKESDLHSPHPEYLALGKTSRERIRAYHQLFAEALRRTEHDAIAKSLSSGYALGDEAFREALERRFGVPQRAKPRGRPRKMGSDPIF